MASMQNYHLADSRLGRSISFQPSLASSFRIAAGGTGYGYGHGHGNFTGTSNDDLAIPRLLRSVLKQEGIEFENDFYWLSKFQQERARCPEAMERSLSNIIRQGHSQYPGQGHSQYQGQGQSPGGQCSPSYMTDTYQGGSTLGGLGLGLGLGFGSAVLGAMDSSTMNFSPKASASSVYHLPSVPFTQAPVSASVTAGRQIYTSNSAHPALLSTDTQQQQRPARQLNDQNHDQQYGDNGDHYHRQLQGVTPPSLSASPYIGTSDSAAAAEGIGEEASV
jgi:hypothetical protein